MGKAGAAGRTKVINPDISDRRPEGHAVKAPWFFHKIFQSSLVF